MMNCFYSILLLIIGLVLSIVGFNYFSRLKQVAKWTAVPAFSTRMEVGCLKRPEGYIYVTYYYPLVRYLYEINGKTYEGTQYCIDSKGWWSTDKGVIEKLVNSARTSAWVYVNPLDSELSVLEKNVSAKRRSHYWGTFLGGVLVSVAAVLSALFMCFD